MRIWRGLKSCGAGALRDGVYVLPDSDTTQAHYSSQAERVREAGGSAHIVHWHPDTDAVNNEITQLFNRDEQYLRWQGLAQDLDTNLKQITRTHANKSKGDLKQQLQTITDIDFFPGVAQQSAVNLMERISLKLKGLNPSDQTRVPATQVDQLNMSQFQRRTWATLWDFSLDRIASAWLIRSCIDNHARFFWIESSSSIDRDTIGFGFDGGQFRNRDDQTTFDVLVKSFHLDEDPALEKIREMIHAMSMGGIPPPEAAGINAVIHGLDVRCKNRDQFFDCACDVFDGLFSSLVEERA